MLDTGSVKRCCRLQIIIIKQISSDICHWHSLEFDIELQIALFSIVFCCPWPCWNRCFRGVKKYLENQTVIQRICLVWRSCEWRLIDKIAFLDFWHIFCTNYNHHLIRAGTLCLPFGAPLLRNRKISKQVSLLNRRLRIKLIGRRAQETAVTVPVWQL